MTKKYYYKAVNKDMRSWEGFQYKMGETYTIESEELEMCFDKVFHFCEKLEDTIDYYDSPTDRHFLIEILGDVVKVENISGSNKIRVVKEINREEIEEYIQDKDSLKAKRFDALFTTNIKRIKELSKSKSWEVLMAIASNPNTSVYLLEKLAKNEHFYVRREVAENSNTPIYILEELAKDEKRNVRREVAENPNTPTHILEELAKDKHWEIRQAVALNPNTPVYILEKLSKDKHWFVLFAVVNHLNTSVYILKKLAKDENKFVKEQAQKRLKEITQ